MARDNSEDLKRKNRQRGISFSGMEIISSHTIYRKSEISILILTLYPIVITGLGQCPFYYESISPSIIEAVVELMEKDEAESGSKAVCQNQV